MLLSNRDVSSETVSVEAWNPSLLAGVSQLAGQYYVIVKVQDPPRAASQTEAENTTENYQCGSSRHYIVFCLFLLGKEGSKNVDIAPNKNTKNRP